jgi:hypothetical protein
MLKIIRGGTYFMSNVGGRYWSLQKPGTLPPSRKAASMAYDSRRGVALLFGGGGRSDTWFWDGSNWHEYFPAITPPPRTCAAMAYDAAREQIVLFGGTDSHGNPLNDTWLWDGSNWHEQYTPSAPPPRSGAAMAFDETSRQIILFGGQTYGGRVGTPLNDTWIWDGTQWHAITSPVVPPARLGANVAYHAATKTMILFGGTAGHTIFQDTWLWDGNAWHRAEVVSNPPARAWAAMVYHHDTQQIVLVGGGGSSGPDLQAGAPLALDDTWAWNGFAWQPLPSQVAPKGSYHSAAYDVANQAIVVYTSKTGKPEQASKANYQLQASYIAPDSETWLWKT